MRKLSKIFSFSLFAICLGSCTADANFSSSPNDRLTFSADTLSLDTVFSNVPSASRSMWVYNRNGEGLRCGVKLAKGNSSAFRVNVDGIFLGKVNNWQTSYMELRKKDSIRIYVEATLPNANGNEPQKNDDDLIFTLQSGVEQSVNLKAWAWNASVLRNVKVSKDTTISSSTPILIYGGLKVDSGAMLTVEAGTTLYFHNDAGINVYGSLHCKGTSDNNVTLRGDRIDRMFDYLPYDRTPGQWQGVKLFSSSYDNELTYTDLHGSYNGIVADSSDIEKQKLLLSHSTIHNCQGVGIDAHYINAKIINTQVTNTLGNCINIIGGEIDINSSTIAQFYPFDSKRGLALYADLNKDIKRMHITNSLITGYSDDVLSIKVSKQPSDWIFSHCVLRTPKPINQDSIHFVRTIFENVKDTMKMGEKQFKKVDAENMICDFHLSKEAVSIDQADTSTSPKDDHDGNTRDEKPDVGAYEFLKNEDK